MPDTRFTTVQRALVYNVTDPEGLKRIQVQIPSILGTSVSGWVWPLNPDAPAPAVDSYVYVEFEGGDPNNAVYHARFAGSGSASDLTAYMQKANNLSDVANAASARSNLGLGSAATSNTSSFLQPANNLSDLGNAATARTSLGLGSAATSSTSSFLQPANNLSDLGNVATARSSLGLGTAATRAATSLGWHPSENGLLGAFCDPGVCGAANALATGVMTMVLCKVVDGGTIGHVDFAVNAAGATMTNAFVGVFSTNGTTATLIGSTATDQSSQLTSTGAKHLPVSVQAGQSLAVAAGALVYVGFLVGSATTAPQLMRASTQNYMSNFNLSAGSFRICSSGSGQTALPTSVTLSSTTSSSGCWAGVSV